MTDLTHFKDNTNGSIVVCDPTEMHQWIKSDYYVEL